MVPPPLSQAGRFKPRKPAKKIRPPDALDVVADGSTTTGRLNEGQGSRGRVGPRGSGRDGRGRGRGRFALPQGQVFFTATPAAAGNSGNISGSHRKSSHSVQFTEATTSGSLNANRTSRLRREVAEASTSEEIVGTLDEAIGSSAPSKVSSGSDFKKSDQAASAFERALLGDQFPAGSCISDELYDSDSSDEAKKKLLKRETMDEYKTPLSLPFPSPRLPVGIGANESFTHDPKNNSLFAKEPEGELRNCPKYASPFVHPNDNDALRFEKNNFFLVQFPTRLPRLKIGQMVCDENENAETTVEDIANVATPALQTSAFDNALSTAVPGRLGKIVIHKSGKTVLILEGPEGKAAVRWMFTIGDNPKVMFSSQIFIYMISDRNESI